MPSTKSAQDDDGIQSERRELLDKAAEDGVIRDYSGVRQASDGRKFKVDGAIVWTITNKDGEKIGQAVRFDSFMWLNEDGTEGEAMSVAEGGQLVPAKAAAPADEPEAGASPEDIEKAAKAVDEQAAEVRRLKDEDGLTNADPEVQDAVAELLKRKSALAALEEEAKGRFYSNIEPETVSKLRPKRSKLSVAHERERERPSTASRPASSLSARRTE
jgi:hypothetical protein